MLKYAVDNGMNRKPLNWKDATASGGMQALSSVFAFGAGAIMGVTGFYNGPGIAKMFSGKWLGNFAASQFIKAMVFHPFNFVFSYLQKSIYSGGR